ncbi:hypothetical protein JCM11251_005470 [Rhodosporidiobolus azoricus]
MAVRRIARQGLLCSEHPPAASAGPSAVRLLSSAVHLSPPTRADSSASTSHSLSRQAASGWAAISKAGHALFNHPAANEAGEVKAVELSGAALDLVNELKRKRSDPHRVWELFQQVDLHGQTHSLPLISLHTLLGKIHLKPRSTRARPLSLQASIAAARQYAAKVDLIRTRLREAGGSTTPGDWHALLAQYRALHHAPGASKVWGEMVQAGFSPKVSMARAVLETYLGWIAMHGRASGRAIERSAAEPLMRKAVTILSDLQRGGKKVDGVVELLLRIAVKAGDVDVFAKAVKEFYAFDVKLPGALVDATERAHVEACAIGEQEVCLMLDAFAEKDDLPAMVAIFETFDHPSPASSADPAFFTRSFSSLSVSDSPTAGSSSLGSSLPSPTPHPIGTRAFTTLIQTAARLGHGPLARHYFDLLYMRWQNGADERLKELELAVGIVPQVAETKAAQLEREAKEVAQDAHEQVEDSGFTPTVQQTVPRRSHSIVSIHGAHLTPPSAQPAVPYTLPSTMIATVAHGALAHYDAVIARWLRMRTRRIVQLMENHTARLAAVLHALEPSSSPSSSADSSSASTPSPTASSPSSPTPSHLALQRELALSTFHLTQLRLTLSSVKYDSNIITSYKELHSLQTALSYKFRRISSPYTGKKDQLRLRPGLRRKEKQVLLHKMLVVRHRLNKLREVEGQGPGRAEYDKYLAEYRVLRSKFEGEGKGWTEQGERPGEVLGQVPHVLGLTQ